MTFSSARMRFAWVAVGVLLQVLTLSICLHLATPPAATVALVSLFSVFLGASYLSAAKRCDATLARTMAELAASRQQSHQSDLLMQEMRHRIKNHITRIQSIARQSARSAMDLPTYIDTFEARLRAMAVVQEIMAGQASPYAELRDILASELRQVLDAQSIETNLQGPDLRLEERQAHAFGLVVHELMTNAMKYGALSPNGRGIRVRWNVEPRSGMVEVIWEERFDHPYAPTISSTGFGSRLVDANVKGDLSGEIKREFHSGGLTVTMTFPVATLPDHLK